MLETAENLAAGLGTQPRSSKAHAPPTQPTATTVAVADTVGNAHLRLWIGERFLGMMISIYLFPCWLFLNLIELYNRTGDKEAAKVQTFKNTNFMEAVARVEARGWNYDEIPLFFQCSRDNAIAFVLSAFFLDVAECFYVASCFNIHLLGTYNMSSILGQLQLARVEFFCTRLPSFCDRIDNTENGCLFLWVSFIINWTWGECRESDLQKVIFRKWSSRS